MLNNVKTQMTLHHISENNINESINIIIYA